MATSTVPFTGVIETSNASGIKFKDGPWLNYSNYGFHPGKNPARDIVPPVGTPVQIQVRNDKFIHALAVAGATPAQPITNTAPMGTAPTTPTLQPSMNTLVMLSAETRQTLLKTVAIAQPGLFSLDTIDTLTELIRNLEQFVLEELVAANTPAPDPDPEDDEPLDDTI